MKTMISSALGAGEDACNHRRWATFLIGSWKLPDQISLLCIALGVAKGRKCMGVTKLPICLPI